MARITLDVTHNQNETLRSALRELTYGTGVATRDTGVRVGGGWPEIEFTGRYAELVVVVRRYDGDGPNVDELVARIEDEPPLRIARGTR